MEEAGQLIVLGSDCFGRRYGVAHAAYFQGQGSGVGRVLTEAEREMLVNNTKALLSQFEAERQRELALAEITRQREREIAGAKLVSLRQLATTRHAEFEPSQILSQGPQHQTFVDSEPLPLEATPLPRWASLKKPNSSFFAYGMSDSQCWVLMQSASHAGCFIAPASIPFEAWDEALPPSLGKVDVDREVYVSDNKITALIGWFASRCTEGSRIDSDASAIQHFALGLKKPSDT